MILTADEIRMILEIIERDGGPGYHKDQKIAKLQAKLSIMAEVARMSR